MKIMLVFLSLCLVVGLWAPPKLKLGGMVTVGAVVMILYFLLAPHQL